MNDGAHGPWRRRAGPALLFLFGCAVSLYYGRRGYMPVDQSIVFDGGWRVLSGQVPFRDYHAPNGFAVHALQALFFGLGGVSWQSYLLHAALVNGLFALLVQRLLVGFGLGARASALWGALSALALYPPIGVPYMEQHAFFFSFAALAWAIGTRRTEDRGLGARQGVWLALPAVLLLAGLSKQIPSAFAIPPVLAVALVDRRERAVRRARALAWGSALALGGLILWGWWAGVDLERLDTYFRRLPAEEGARRLDYVPGFGKILERMRYTGDELGLGVVDVVHVAAGLGLLALIVYPVLRGRARARKRLLAPLAPVLLAEALLATCLLFVALTSNQAQVGMPYVFVAAGLVHVGLERARGSLLALRRVWLGLWPRLLAAGVVALGLVDGWHFTSTVNATRSVNDIAWDPEVAGLAAPQMPAALAFMRWQVPQPHILYGPRDLREVASYLEEQGAPFLLIGDASILYGLTGQPSAAPSLWFHPGLTLPLADDARFAAYEDLLIERIHALGVRFVVLEGEHTWIRHLSLASFPRLQALVEQRRAGSERFGAFEVVELGA